MPTNTSTTSEMVDEASSAPSVLDFRYHDSRRIGSFLSQFEGDGHLQQLTRTKDGSRGKKDSSAHEMKGNVGVAAGVVKGGTEIALEMAEGYARVFDPYWANARAFLDHLSEHGMLQRDLGVAQIGQFVLVKGWLSILDLVMFKDVWKLPAIQRKIINEGTGTNKSLSQMTSSEKAAYKEQKENTEMLIEMMQIMPHSVHASMITSDDSPNLVWCSLRDEYLVTPASDIALAHGSTMPGEWSLVGILNAGPEFSTPDLSQDNTNQVPGLMRSVVGQVSETIAPIVRVALGRPAAASAITPLLIFREVA